MIRKVYAEITNVCNLNCSFCHGTKREKKFITLDEFDICAKQVSALTEYIYLHLMGEPLLHPQLKEILEVCKKYELKATITTNGTLLDYKIDDLMCSDALYKLCISVHSFEDNKKGEFEKYMFMCCKSAELLNQKGVIVSFRLWNEGGMNSLNSKILDFIKNYFCCGLSENSKGFTLKKGLYIEIGEIFMWPDNSNEDLGENCFCYGLRDQIGILCDGTVVPCCLDADGSIPLGNIYNEKITDIIKKERAMSIYNGFSSKKAREELCKKCSYARRFSK